MTASPPSRRREPARPVAAPTRQRYEMGGCPQAALSPPTLPVVTQYPSGFSPLITPLYTPHFCVPRIPANALGSASSYAAALMAALLALLTTCPPCARKLPPKHQPPKPILSPPFAGPPPVSSISSEHSPQSNGQLPSLFDFVTCSHLHNCWGEVAPPPPLPPPPPLLRFRLCCHQASDLA